jgi:hypothetical protein
VGLAEPTTRKKATGTKKAAPKKKAPAEKKETKSKIKKTVAGKVSKAKKDTKKAVNGATKKVCFPFIHLKLCSTSAPILDQRLTRYLQAKAKTETKTESK